MSADHPGLTHRIQGSVDGVSVLSCSRQCPTCCVLPLESCSRCDDRPPPRLSMPTTGVATDPTCPFTTPRTADATSRPTSLERREALKAQQCPKVCPIFGCKATDLLTTGMELITKCTGVASAFSMHHVVGVIALMILTLTAVLHILRPLRHSLSKRHGSRLGLHGWYCHSARNPSSVKANPNLGHAATAAKLGVEVSDRVVDSR